MLHHTDSDDASYLELSEFIATYGDVDHIVFNIVAANRDDHLRNHGFIRSPAGWRLSPAYDMNPSFRKEEHVLSLDLYNRQPDLECAPPLSIENLCPADFIFGWHRS